VKGGVYGSVDFIEDDSLANEAYVDFYVEYDSRVFGKTKFCGLENAHDGGSGVGIFVSVSLGHRVGSCILIFGFGGGFRVLNIPEGKRRPWRESLFICPSS